MASFERKWDDMFPQLLWCLFFVAVVTAAQLLPVQIILAVAIVLIVVGILQKRIRTIMLLSALFSLGHIIWVVTAPRFESLVQGSSRSQYLEALANRFGLWGYLAVFLVWNAIQPPTINTLAIGNFKASIRFPAIWKGRKETTTSFLVVFCAIFSIATIIAAVIRKSSYVVICYGVIFSIVNAVLEETLWRGSILPRLADVTAEPMALIVSAIAFGLYHLSLGFPIWACLTFAIGGIYMGGIALTSRGLLPSIIMHIVVNMGFVVTGLVF